MGTNSSGGAVAMSTRTRNRLAVGLVALVAIMFGGGVVAEAAHAAPQMNINWSNRGPGDGFDTIFGTQQDQARAVIDAAIDHWERVIVALNRTVTPGDQIDITVNANPGSSATSCGGSAGTTFDATGWPTAGNVNINGNAGNWFVDPTPDDHSEFAGNIDNAFSGDAQSGSPAAGLCDMYSVMALEMTHVLGISSSGGRFQTGGYNTPFAGTSPTCSGPGSLWRFTGSSISALMTSNNGGQDGQDRTVPVHTAEPCGTAGGFVGANDVGNALFEGSRRYIPGNLVAMVLEDAYNYSLVMPETFGTFYAVLDSTTGELLVRGGDDNDTSADTITINRAGDNVAVSVDVGNDVPGTGPTDAFVSSFPVGQVQHITVDAGDGDDRVTFGPNVGIPADVNGDAGNDILTGEGITLNGGAGADFLSGGLVSDTLNGGAGNDEIYGFEGADTITGGSENDVIYAAEGADNVAGDSGNDEIYAGAGDNTVTDGTGNDLVDLTENSKAVSFTGEAGDDTILGSTFNDTLGGGSGVDRLEGRNGNDTITGGSGNDSLFGQDGSDTFAWSLGHGNDVVEGGAGESDALSVTGGGGSDDFAVRAPIGSRVEILSSGSPLASLGSIEDIRIASDSGSDSIAVADLFGTEIRKVRLEPGSEEDQMLIDGREISELIEASPVGASHIAVGGFAYDLVVAGDVANDTLNIRGNGGNDVLMASGTSGNEALGVAPLTHDEALLEVGGLDIHGFTVEDVRIEGRGGDDSLTFTTPTGPQEVSHAPGLTRDSGELAIPGLLPIRYASLGLPGSVQIADGGSESVDTLIAKGTLAADTVSVLETGVIGVNSQSPIDPTGIAQLVLDAGLGDDSITAAAGVPFAATTVNGGDSVEGDRLSLTGASGPVVVDADASTVTGYGGIVQVASIEDLRIGQNGTAGTDLTVLGSDDRDDITYRPTGAQAGVITASTFPAKLRFGGTEGAATIDPLGDSDKVTMLGTLSDDTFTVKALPVSTLQLGTTKTVQVPQATAEKISVLSDEGGDTFDVFVYDSVAARLFLFGDQPSSKRFSEQVNVYNGSTSHVQYRDVKSHEFEAGSAFASYKATGNETRVDYESVEKLRFFR